MAGNREYFPAVRRVQGAYQASNGPRASTTIEIAQRSGIEETPGGKISEED
jgi:hypothetical protein